MIHGRFSRPGRLRAWSWTLLALAALASCSTKGRKDQSYGQDVGLVYEPIEASVPSDARSRDGGAARDGDGDGTAADGGADAGDAATDAE